MRTPRTEEPNPEHPRLDELIDQQARTVEPAERARLIQDAARIVAEDLPYLPIWYEDQALAIRDGLKYDNPSAWWFFQPWVKFIRATS